MEVAKLNSPIRDVPILGYQLAFLREDRAGMDDQLAAGRNTRGGEELMSHLEALALARAGRVESGAKRSQRAIELANQGGHRESAAIYEGAVAAWTALFGEQASARQRAAAALRLSKGRDAEYAAAFALALVGDIAQSRSIADDLAKRYPDDTSVQFSYLPTLRALISLHAGQPSQAIEQLKVVNAYEFADPAISFFGYFGNFYPAYVRSQAYLAAHRPVDASKELQKILDHRGLLLGDPLGARVQLDLGRALALAGDAAHARTAYQGFLTLWKDADPDIAILRQARAEYARLQ